VCEFTLDAKISVILPTASWCAGQLEHDSDNYVIGETGVITNQLDVWMWKRVDFKRHISSHLTDNNFVFITC